VFDDLLLCSHDLTCSFVEAMLCWADAQHSMNVR